MRVYPYSRNLNESVKWLLELVFPHVVQSFAAFTYSSKLYIMQEAGGQSFNDYMSLGAKFSSKILLHQLSGIAETIQEISEVHLVRHYRHEDRRYAFGLTPERILVFPDGPSIFRLSIDVSHFRAEIYWGAHHEDHEAPEALKGGKYREVDWRAEFTWCIGCTYLEILMWHVMGYDGLTEFRNRLSQPNSRPYFFSPAEPGTDGGIREHEAVVTIFQALHSQTDGCVREAVHLVQRMLAIDPYKRPTASSLASEFRNLATQEERADKEARANRARRTPASHKQA